MKKNDKFIKNGEVTNVKDILDIPFVGYCIVFGDQYNTRVLTKSDFLEQYKPYEPVYEYEYCLEYKDGGRGNVSPMTEDEFKLRLHESDIIFFKRLDFAKRERVQ